VNKIPYIEHSLSGGLKGECAYLWCLFLANEADMRDDVLAYDKWKAMAETLAPKPGVPVPESVHYPALEDEIGKYHANSVRIR